MKRQTNVYRKRYLRSRRSQCQVCMQCCCVCFVRLAEMRQRVALDVEDKARRTFIPRSMLYDT